MKPIIRWTIGPVNKNGFICLAESVKSFIDIYGDLFEYVVFHNNLECHHLKYLNKIKTLNVKTIAQKSNRFRSEQLQIKDKRKPDYHIDENPGDYPTIWKVLSPRVNKDVHEIYLDNDVVLFDRLEEIDSFLESNRVLVYEGLYGGAHGSYGLFAANSSLNAGIFGVPPMFDLDEKIETIIRKTPEFDCSKKFFEQGIVTSILDEEPNPVYITQATIPIFEPQSFVTAKAHKVLREAKFFLHPNGVISPLEFEIPPEHIAYSDCVKFFKVLEKYYSGVHFVGINYHRFHFAWSYFSDKYKLSS